MGTIFDIQNDILKAFNSIEENEGDITPEIQEQLAISKENLINKVKSYVGVIKTLENDKGLIKEEIDRLKALDKAKSKSIYWLKQTLMDAIENFGEVDKNGKKFIDYNLGKVSVSTREVVEVDEDEVDFITDKIISGMTWLNSINQLSRDFASGDDLIEFINAEERDYSFGDLRNIGLDIDVNLSLEELIDSEEGFELAKALIKYNKFKLKAKADKTTIKEINKANQVIPAFAKIVDNKSILIK